MARIAVSPDGATIANARLPFKEQIAFFRQKLGRLIPTQRWDDLRKNEHDKAFMVAGAMKADLLADLAKAVDQAVAEGKSIQWFRKNFFEIVARHGWTGYTGAESPKRRAWRTRVIYQTNLLTSYSAGRLAQLKEGGFKYWIYHHDDSVRHPRPLHQAWDGLTLPADHDFWKTHYPPNGWGCQCYLSGARSERGARRLGGDPDKPIDPEWLKTEDGVPVGIDKGWDYMPGATVADTVRALRDKLDRLPPELAAEVGAQWLKIGAVQTAYQDWIKRVLSGRERNELGLVGVIKLELLHELAKRETPPSSAAIYLRPGLVVGPKARRHQQKGDALDDAEWQGLVELLATPAAVLLDRNSGRLIYLLEATRNDGRTIQLAVDLEYRVRRPKGQIPRDVRTNMIVSAYRPRLETLRDRLRRGDLEMIHGEMP